MDLYWFCFFSPFFLDDDFLFLDNLDDLLFLRSVQRFVTPVLRCLRLGLEAKDLRLHRHGSVFNIQIWFLILQSNFHFFFTFLILALYFFLNLIIIFHMLVISNQLLIIFDEVLM